MEEMGYRYLAAAIIFRAIQDLKAGHPCNGQCCPEENWHICAADALDFLQCESCRALLEALDIDPDAALAHLPLPERLDRRLVVQLPLFVLEANKGKGGRGD